MLEVIYGLVCQELGTQLKSFLGITVSNSQTNSTAATSARWSQCFLLNYTASWDLALYHHPSLSAHWRYLIDASQDTHTGYLRDFQFTVTHPVIPWRLGFLSLIVIVLIYRLPLNHETADFQPTRLLKALKALSKGAKWIKFLLGRESYTTDCFVQIQFLPQRTVTQARFLNCTFVSPDG